MSIEIKVPALGESVTEATVARWFKQEGDAVTRDEPLLELETDKVTVEVPAPAAGALAGIAVKPGGKVEVGALLGLIEEGASGNPTPHVPSNPDAVQPKPNALEMPAVEPKPAPVPPPRPANPNASREERVPMNRLRQTVALRLKEAQNTAAMLTTFNEADMSAVIALRGRYRETFEKTYGVRLGFMGFFVKAAVAALKEFPAVNAAIDGNEIVYKHYYDIGVAVATERGLVVPVVRDADRMPLAEIEKTVAGMAARAREGKLKIEELSGGTFSITNGGVFGSLLSTPILNRPQSGILGMHKIQDRPVAVEGQAVVRPMMYLALTYDHRLVDGREAVRFLVRIKECLEDPHRLLLNL